jgi:excisionase family DNA binding protein
LESLLTTYDVAALLEVHLSTVCEWVDQALLPGYRTPGGHRRVRREDLVAFLKEHRMPIPPTLVRTALQVLVIDEEKAVLDSVKRALKRNATVQVHTATSSAEGALLTSELKPDAVLVDLNSPTLDGLEICRAIRRRDHLRSIQLVTMASRPTPALKEKSRQAGARACLVKPVEVEELLRLLVLQRGRPRKRPTTRGAGAPGP